MRGTDKYLIIFAVAVVALVIAALTITAMRPEETYRDGTTAEDAAHDYLLALENGDYERAYALLSPNLDGYPADLQEFTKQVNWDQWQFPTADESASLAVVSVDEMNGWATADVRVTTYYGPSLFGPNRHSSVFQLELEQVDGAWKVVDGQRLFLPCWSRDDCK